jgi:subtilase family serine protease
MNNTEGPVGPQGVSAINRNLVVIALVAALGGCAGSHPVVPASNAVWNLTLTPDHGASALPGATLPCGFPGHSAAHHASCPVAVNVRVPAIRNPHVPAATIPGLHPNELVAAYGFPSNATGMTVAIVDAYDDTRAETDMNTYRSEFGLPPCTTANGCFRKVNESGRERKYPRSSRAWSQEIALDLEMVSAVCPRCPILLVEADTPSIADLGAAVDTAVRLGAKVVSNSYYAVEWPGETAEDVHYNHPGIAITVSSGDKAAAYYPAASPYVTAVGGLTVNQTASPWAETAWRYGGRGCSLFEARPAFQPAVCATRSTVDMAMVADPQSGVTEFSTQSGGWVVAGGTSIGAPIIAAAYALSGNPQGAAFSYAHAGDFRSVGPGAFNLATGLGSPIGVAGL